MSSSVTVLIAEDDMFLQNMMSVELEEKGYTVEKAQNGQVALDRMKEGGVDILLLDILMPVMDGFQVLDHMKQEKITLPVIIMSNLGQQEDIQKCIDLGAKDYFIKSDVDLDNVVKTIQTYI